MNRFLNVLFAAASLVLATSTFAADEVKALKTQSTVTSHYGFSYQTVTYDAIVKNLAYTKEVYAHMTNPDGNWIDVPLRYKYTAGDGREVWSGFYSDYNNRGIPSNRTWTVEYTLKYVVNGKTYWDNNNGLNYQIKPDSGAYLVGTMVYPQNYTAEQFVSGNLFEGNVLLKNLAPAKDVEIVYTTDGWKTSKSAIGRYNPYFWSGIYSNADNPNEYGYEAWYYYFDIGSASKVEYAIRYTVNGTTYWDNNFGANYSVTIKR